jgi:transcriptional regulator with XRE-family HTH domain
MCYYFLMATKPDIKEWLKLTGLSTEVLAKKAGITRQTLSNVIHGHHKTSFETAMEIWEATGYEVNLISLYPRLKRLLPAIRCIKGEINERGEG